MTAQNFQNCMYIPENIVTSRYVPLLQKEQMQSEPQFTLCGAQDMCMYLLNKFTLLYRSESFIPYKAKKAPIPLPRHKKHSFDSNQQSTTDKHHPPPLTKPKPHPRISGQSSLSSVSITSTSSLMYQHPVLEELTANVVDSEAVGESSTDNEPMYANLTSSPTQNGEEEGKKEMEGGQGEEVIVETEEGEVMVCSYVLESRDIPASYSLSPSKSCDKYLAAGGDYETPPTHVTVPPSKSCDILTSPLPPEENVKQTQPEPQRPLELQLQDQVVPTPSADSPGREGSPTLDDFLAKILKRRRESQDINQECDNESNDYHHSARYPLNRTRSNNPRIGMRTSAQVDSPQTPHYYNLPPLLRTKGLTMDEEEDDKEGDSCDRNGSDEKKKECRGESLTEKEYRSEWLSSVQDWMPMTKKDGNESSDDEDPYSVYLKILPSTLPHPPHHTEHRPMSPTLEEQHSNSTPESESPLWGTHRANSRQSTVPSPLAQVGAENSPPLSPKLQDPSEAKGIKRSSPLSRKRRMGGSRRRSQRRGTLSRGGIKLPSQDQTDLDWSPQKRSSTRQKQVVGMFQPGPLPSLPGASVDVDSDYEWAEVEEVLSDTGSDCIYSSPFDLGLEYHPRRSASCSELAAALSGPLSIGQRPPAPLPLASDGK